MKNNRFKLVIIILTALFFAGGCNPEYDVAPYLTYEGEANCTIEELLSYHDIGSSDSYDSIPAGTVITGIVTSSDEHGNCYKFINIQDETGAIQIKIANTALYYKYKVGQRVYINCDGLVLGDYRKLPQLGWWVNGAMEAIPTAKEAVYIFRDSLVGNAPEPLSITSTGQINDSYYNMLVKIENCYFNNGGQLTFSEPSTATSRTITLVGGGTIEVRTSNYADFAQNILPEGTGNIVGLLTRYNNYNQLVIRSLDDLSNFGVEEEIYSLDLNVNPLDNGWSNHSVSGTALWEYVSGVKRMSITGNNSEFSDCWLLSPTINLTSYQDIKLYLNHRIPNNLGNASNMRLYYSVSDPSAPFNEANWVELTMPSYPSSFTTVSIDIPNAAISSPNFRIGLRYSDDQTSNWTIGGVTFKSFIAEK